MGVVHPLVKWLLELSPCPAPRFQTLSWSTGRYRKAKRMLARGPEESKQVRDLVAHPFPLSVFVEHRISSGTAQRVSLGAKSNRWHPLI